MVTVYATKFNIKGFYVLPWKRFSLLWILEQTTIISLHTIILLVSITHTNCVYCAVRLDSFNLMQFNLCKELSSSDSIFFFLFSYRDLMTPLQRRWVKDVLQNIGCSVILCARRIYGKHFYIGIYLISQGYEQYDLIALDTVWQRTVDTWEYAQCFYTSCGVTSLYHTRLRNDHFATGGPFWYSFKHRL